MHVKVNGYVDQVFVDYVGQLVKKGDPLFTMYSPDLVATQEEYLIAKRGNTTLQRRRFRMSLKAPGACSIPLVNG